ncbi:unnamed protein product [Bursaphelenchus okinawaensis]|uniref:Small ribosomal subunit protein uS2 n=1 Tax=Bursaphelenchus okinawaensis TaxID=465554 RepID=A0A811KRZ7_9BILA|nr:unnamed protein product [Bursaphelenchus okinawaensis]CAG9110367.1 unnamed protein product [Bursaphelenchus okinawaensis]
MSGGHDELKLNSDDAFKLLACESHIGTTQVDYQSEQYVYKRRADGTYLINVAKTWEKLLLAARAIAAVENPADVCVVSSREYAQRALLKYAAHTGATPIFGRFVPGSLTNQIQKNFREPRLIVVSDPRLDHQAITEASYVNIPVIAFTNSDSPLKHVDIAIPCNNKGIQSTGLLWWFLAREVLQLRGKISRSTGFVLEDKLIMPDLYFYRDPEETKKEEAGETTEDKRDVFDAGNTRQEDFTTGIPGTEPMKIDFKFQQIDDWAAASSDQPQGQGEQAATTEWGASGSGWN